MRVLLTGGTGFVGSHVARALVAAGHVVRALRREERPATSTLPVEWVRGDVLDPGSLRAAAAGCEVVVHAAADLRLMGSPAALRHQHEVNVTGTRHVIDAAVGAGARRLLFTSSVAAIGRPLPGDVGDETRPYDWPPGLPYNESKRDAERVALSATARGLEVIALNPALVLGPEEPHRRSLPFLKAIDLGLARLAPPGGLTVCDVRDVAFAHVAALDHGRSGERYILGGPGLTVRALLAEFARALHAPGPIATLPAWSLELAGAPLVALGHLLPLPLAPAALTAFLGERYYSSRKAVTELSYRETPIETLVDDTVASYRAAGLI